MELAEVYNLTAALLTYPDAELPARIAYGKELVSRTYPEELPRLAALEEGVKPLSPESLEELYVATFDVQAACCLEVGYAVFGEDYKRGRCLAELKVLHERNGVDCGTELPDFLPNLLRLLPKLSYGDAAELAHGLVIPAVDKMIAGFGEQANPYRHVLELAGDVLKRDYSSS